MNQICYPKLECDKLEVTKNTKFCPSIFPLVVFQSLIAALFFKLTPAVVLAQTYPTTDGNNGGSVTQTNTSVSNIIPSRDVSFSEEASILPVFPHILETQGTRNDLLSIKVDRKNVVDHENALPVPQRGEVEFSSPGEPKKPAFTPSPEELKQQIEDLQQRLQVLDGTIPDLIWMSSPGYGSNVPTAYGAYFGDVGIGANFQSRTRFTGTSDGAIGIVVGLGDPYNAVGFDVGISINDLGISGNEAFGERGSFFLKLHRVLPEDFSIAVGLDNAFVWGGSDGSTSVYGVVSKAVKLQESRFKPLSRLYLNVGVGTGDFRTENQINNHTGSLGIFGSIALRVIDQMNVFTEWSQDFNAGLSIAPFPDIPIVITPAVLDVTGNAGDGARFNLGLSYGFRL